jgi:hypothetical protein
VESQEFDYNRRSDDGTIPPNSRCSHWEREWTRGINTVGLSGVCNPERVISQMKQAGFINITRLDFKLPVGPWPRDARLRQAGLFALVMHLEGLHGLSAKVFLDLLDYTVDQLEMFLMECRQEIKTKSIHSYWPVQVLLGHPDTWRSPIMTDFLFRYVIYGQKPPSSSEI